MMIAWRVQAYRGYRWIMHGVRLACYHTYMSFLDGEGVGVVFLTNMESPPARASIPPADLRPAARPAEDRLKRTATAGGEGTGGTGAQRVPAVKPAACPPDSGSPLGWESTLRVRRGWR